MKSLILCLSPFLLLARLGHAATSGIFTFTDNGSSITIDNCSAGSTSDSILIPDTINGKPVTAIGPGALAYCHYTTSITIPATVTSIGSEAFMRCWYLTSINIPAGVTQIHSGTFSYCKSLSAITLPSGLTAIGANAFNECANLKSIEIPASVTSIGANAFQNCRGLTTFTPPPLLTSISEGMLRGAMRLETMNLHSRIQSIDKWAFAGTNLQSVTLPSSVTALGDGVFAECFALRQVKIQGAVASLPDSLFWNCTRLHNVRLPKTVQTVGSMAFLNTPIQKIELPAVQTIGEFAFGNCEGLVTIQLPKSLKTIQASAFSGCKSLASVRFQGNAPTVGAAAFRDNARGFKFFIENTSKGFSIPRWNGRPTSLPSPEIVVRSAGNQADHNEYTEKFGSQAVGKRGAPHVIQIWNVGNRPLTGIHTSLSNRSQFHFVLLGKPKANLPAGAGTMVRLAFKPLTKGRHRDALTIVSGDRDESPFTVGAAGFGVEVVD